jgi:hypothetical protein
MEQIKPNKYHGGKIYALRSPSTDKIYIGSTIQPLFKRKHEHKNKKNNDISKLDDFYIELLEDFKCENIEQLNKREGELIRLHNDKCCNKKIAGRTKKEYREEVNYNKTYYTNHMEDIKKQNKEYYEANKSIINKKKKQIYKENKKLLSNTTI